VRMMVRESVFVDTWGWMALGHAEEPRHSEVKRTYKRMRSDHILIYTSDYVLDELVTLLFRREVFDEALRFVEGILAAAALGQVRIERITSDRFSEAWRLRKQFQDKPRISFTDLTSMAMMQELDIHHVLTADDHFLQVGMGFIRVPE
jgi:uncharacterized protein